MTGAEHYREAERLLHDPGWEDPHQIAQAQVHATLALFDHVREIGDQLDARGRFTVTERVQP